MMDFKRLSKIQHEIEKLESSKLLDKFEENIRWGAGTNSVPLAWIRKELLKRLEN